MVSTRVVPVSVWAICFVSKTLKSLSLPAPTCRRCRSRRSTSSFTTSVATPSATERRMTFTSVSPEIRRWKVRRGRTTTSS